MYGCEYTRYQVWGGGGVEKDGYLIVSWRLLTVNGWKGSNILLLFLRFWYKNEEKIRVEKQQWKARHCWLLRRKTESRNQIIIVCPVVSLGLRLDCSRPLFEKWRDNILFVDIRFVKLIWFWWTPFRYLHFNQIDHLDPQTFSNVPSLERL